MDDNTVTLVIPCAPEYVSVVRLTILGVSSRLGFSYDAVEDIRLAVAEACTNAIARSRGAEATTGACRITLRATSDAEGLTVEVADNIRGGTAALPDAEPIGEGDFDGAELGIMLMELCMDEVLSEETPEGHRVRLVKKNDRPMAL